MKTCSHMDPMSVQTAAATTAINIPDNRYREDRFAKMRNGLNIVCSKSRMCGNVEMAFGESKRKKEVRPKCEVSKEGRPRPFL